MTPAELVQEYNALPQHLRDEVADFIAFLKLKVNDGPKKRGFEKDQYDKQSELDGPINGYEDYIMDWSL